MKQRQIYREILHKYYGHRHFERSTKFKGEYVALCYYCDAIAYERDHVPPLKYVWKEVMEGRYEILSTELIIVPACSPCNKSLAAKPLLTLEVRKEYLCNNPPAKVVRRPRGYIADLIKPKTRFDNAKIKRIAATNPYAMKHPSYIRFDIPKNAHTSLATWAKELGTSVNTLCSELLMDSVKRIKF